jgi:hypothetical protein
MAGLSHILQLYEADFIQLVSSVYDPPKRRLRLHKACPFFLPVAEKILIVNTILISPWLMTIKQVSNTLWDIKKKIRSV